MRTPLRLLLVTAVVPLLALGGVAVGGATAADGPTWAPAETATIHPGVQTVTDGAQCTANFIFQDSTSTYIGQAAHCASLGAPNETDGCTTRSLPLGTKVTVRGATRPGELVYSSWLTMQAVGEKNQGFCRYNDFALVRLDPADSPAQKINPSVPFWGGPVALGTESETGSDVYSYGNSGLRFGLAPTSPKAGTSLGQADGGRSHVVYTASPGVPGDSGSAFLNERGEAIGVLSTIALYPLVASNNVSDLARALDYMKTRSPFTAVELVLGTEPFQPLL